MKVLIIVENLPVPFDRRVWQEATALKKNGCQVMIICPAMKGYTLSYETIDGIHVYRHPLAFEGSSAGGYLIEYTLALYFQFVLAVKIFFKHGFDTIHACNPPDTIFLVGGFFKLFFNKKFIFDHHDINPELYIAKFGKKDLLYKLLCLLEKWTFKTADVSIATNESYKAIAIERGKMSPDKVFVVRSGPDLQRTRPVPADSKWKNGKKYLVGYVGVMGPQEGLDLLIHGITYAVKDLKRKDTHFVLAGDGTEKRRLETMARQMEIHDYLTFTGRVPDRMLMEMLSTADVCVNPDIVNEMNDKSTMNKIMEYMALGKPIVQFEMTEGRYTAQESSLYALPNDYRSLMDNIFQIIDHPELGKQMGQCGQHRVVTKLQWKHEIPKLLEAYQPLR